MSNILKIEWGGEYVGEMRNAVQDMWLLTGELFAAPIPRGEEFNSFLLTFVNPAGLGTRIKIFSDHSPDLGIDARVTALKDGKLWIRRYFEDSQIVWLLANIPDCSDNTRSFVYDNAKWDKLRTSHQDAVLQLLSYSRKINLSCWQNFASPRKWSPAQIVLHVTLAYEKLERELAGAPPMRIRTSGFQRVFLRSLFLPILLRYGRIPSGVASPEELLPADANLDQEKLLACLRESAMRFEKAIIAAPAYSCITHPIFGKLKPRQALRFVTIHTRHHALQLERIAQLAKSTPAAAP